MIDNLVSVLIPAFNHEKYVQETIKSIINQTYQNIEIIVIDDGSHDNTWQKIQEMKDTCEQRFSRVILETKSNEGTALTLNQLLNKSQGEYVYIIASDDIAKPDAIEKEINFLNNNSDYALVVGNNEFIDSQGKVCYWDKEQNIKYSKKDAFYLNFGEYLQKSRKLNFSSSKFGSYKTIYLGNYIPNGYLIRKDIFKQTGFFTAEAPLEDYYLMLQISKYAKMKYLDEILFSYRWHENNSIKNIQKMNLYADKTLNYEKQILDNINENLVFSDVIEAKKYGVCYKKLGIPYLFQILTYKKINMRIKILKMFGITVYSYTKR